MPGQPGSFGETTSSHRIYDGVQVTWKYIVQVYSCVAELVMAEMTSAVYRVCDLSYIPVSQTSLKSAKTSALCTE